MDYLVMKALFQLMIDKSHREFIKAIISIETDVEDDDRLNRLYAVSYTHPWLTLRMAVKT